MAPFKKQMPEIFVSAFYGLFATKEILRFLMGLNLSSLCTCQAEVAYEEEFASVIALVHGSFSVLSDNRINLSTSTSLDLHDSCSSAPIEAHCQNICSDLKTTTI